MSDAIFSSLKRDFGNPSSSHRPGMQARKVIEDSREIISTFLGCGHDEIYFTSGGTESNNLALIGAAALHKKGHIITSAIEHPSVIKTCGYLESLGFEVTYVRSDSDGIVSIDDIRHAVRKDTVLISIMHSNNETGVIQPVDEIGRIAEEYGITFHVDAAQSIGKIPFSMNGSGIDLLTVVSHKFYGPKGIGALYIKNDVKIAPVFFGAGHEKGLRPGTENVAGIAGFGKTCLLSGRDVNSRAAHATRLSELLLGGLQSSIPGVGLNGHPSKRLPNTLNLRIPGISSFELIEKIRDRVAISSGSACHSGRQTPSGVLKNIGLTDEDALSSIRLSTGKDNTEDEVNEAVGIIANAVNELKKK